MRLVINAVANIDNGETPYGRPFDQEDIDDIKEDLEDGIRYYGGKAVLIEAHVE